MKIVKRAITIREIKEMADKMFGDLVKAVVDVEKKIMAIDGELHADEEALLLKNGSKQKNLWGINLYPDYFGKKDFIEYDSMINIRPSQQNMTRNVEDPKLKKNIKSIVDKLVIK